jgi:hypothetical protein
MNPNDKFFIDARDRSFGLCGTNDVPKHPPKQPEIFAQAERIDKTIEALRCRVEVLEQKLSPVLSTRPKEGIGIQDSPASSPLGSTLKQFGDNIDSVACTVIQIIERLEL